jgi:hypothetical protein
MHVRIRPRNRIACQSTDVNGVLNTVRDGGPGATHHLALLVGRRHDCGGWLLSSSSCCQKLVLFDKVLVTSSARSLSGSGSFKVSQGIDGWRPNQNRNLDARLQGSPQQPTSPLSPATIAWRTSPTCQATVPHHQMPAPHAHTIRALWKISNKNWSCGKLLKIITTTTFSSHQIPD